MPVGVVSSELLELLNRLVIPRNAAEIAVPAAEVNVSSERWPEGVLKYAAVPTTAP